MRLAGSRVGPTTCTQDQDGLQGRLVQLSFLPRFGLWHGSSGREPWPSAGCGVPARCLMGTLASWGWEHLPVHHDPSSLSSTCLVLLAPCTLHCPLRLLVKCHFIRDEIAKIPRWRQHSLEPRVQVARPRSQPWIRQERAEAQLMLRFPPSS